MVQSRLRGIRDRDDPHLRASVRGGVVREVELVVADDGSHRHVPRRWGVGRASIWLGRWVLEGVAAIIEARWTEVISRLEVASYPNTLVLAPAL